MSDLEKFNVGDIKGLKKIKKHTWVVEFKPFKKKKMILFNTQLI